MYRRDRSRSKRRVPRVSLVPRGSLGVSLVPRDSLARPPKSCREVEEAEPATDATAHGAPMSALKAHLRSLAAIVGLEGKGDESVYKVTPLSEVTLPFVWLGAVRKEVCRKHGVPEGTVLLKLLPEVGSKCEFPILRLSSPLSVVIRNHHHHSCFRLRSSLSFVIRNILPLAHGST